MQFQGLYRVCLVQCNGLGGLGFGGRNRVWAALGQKICTHYLLNTLDSTQLL